MRGRRRVIAVIKAWREQRLTELEPAPGSVELLVLFRGSWRAVDRNRIRRRLRAAARTCAAAPAARRIYVVPAERKMLTMSWTELLNRI